MTSGGTTKGRPELINKTIKALTQLEESLWRVETRHDPVFMRDVFASDLFEFGQSGKVYSVDELLEVPGGTPFRATLPLKNLKARHLSEDVVQITYVSELDVGDSIQRANRSSIWSYSDSKWRLRFHQGTPLVD